MPQRKRTHYQFEFSGELPKNIKLRKRRIYLDLIMALESLEKLFFCHEKSRLPNEETDRILLWQRNPSLLTQRVVWAFVGSEWSYDEDLPGLEGAHDILPSTGTSLYQLCVQDDEARLVEAARQIRARHKCALTSRVQKSEARKDKTS